ncbi:MAG TPA: STAS domain-containing protein [Terriglobia bacterium]|nr:STAS domain-containing protein [Terriglobia bacterium]
MTIEATKIGKAVVLKLIGRMDADTSKQFEAAWDKSLQDGSKFLIVDVSDLTYINSAGVGSFVRNGKLALEKQGALLVCGLKGFVMEIFQLTQLTKVFPVFDSTEAAIKSIS